MARFGRRKWGRGAKRRGARKFGGYKRKRGGKRLKRVIRREIFRTAEKDYQDQISSVSATATGSVIYIAPPGQNQGVTNNTRVKNEIRKLSMMVRFAAIVADTTNIVRVSIIVWNRNSVLSVPSIANIYENSANYWLSPFRRVNMQQKILVPVYDAILNMSTTFRPQIIKTLKFFGKRFPYKRYTFDTGGSATGNHDYYLVILSDSLAASHPAVQYYIRTTYTDT